MSIPLNKLTLGSTLKDLNLEQFQIDASTQVTQVVQHFQANPQLPGVVVLENDKFLIMISQKQFWEYMSRPYSVQLSATRSIKYICDLLKLDNFILPSNTLIINAVEQYLHQASDVLEEAITVQTSPKSYQLIHTHQLLLAYAQINKLINNSLEVTYQQLEKSRKQLEKLTELDPLTNLANRSTFEKYLAQQWHKSSKLRGSLSLIMCELDYFKEYNQVSGFFSGDECLKQIAQIIRATIKKQKAQSLAARYGGSRFVILLSNQSVRKSSEIAQDIQKQLNYLKIFHSRSKISSYLTISFGIAKMNPSLANAPKTLLRAAERALYQVQQTGGNRQTLWKSFFQENNPSFDTLSLKN